MLQLARALLQAGARAAARFSAQPEVAVVLLAPIALAHVRPLVLIETRRCRQFRLVHIGGEAQLLASDAAGLRSEIQQTPRNQGELLARASRSRAGRTGHRESGELNAAGARTDDNVINRAQRLARRALDLRAIDLAPTEIISSAHHGVTKFP